MNTQSERYIKSPSHCKGGLLQPYPLPCFQKIYFNAERIVPSYMRKIDILWRFYD